MKSAFKMRCHFHNERLTCVEFKAEAVFLLFMQCSFFSSPFSPLSFYFYSLFYLVLCLISAFHKHLVFISNLDSSNKRGSQSCGTFFFFFPDRATNPLCALLVIFCNQVLSHPGFGIWFSCLFFLWSGSVQQKYNPSHIYIISKFWFPSKIKTKQNRTKLNLYAPNNTAANYTK